MWGRRFKSGSAIGRTTVPEYISNILVLPVTRKPLFPSTLRNLVIKDPQVVAAMQKLWDRGTPYVGTFLTKKDDYELDTVSSLNDIYRIGSLSQIVSIDTADDQSMTATVLPHRRIRITDLFPPDEVEAFKVATNIRDDEVAVEEAEEAEATETEETKKHFYSPEHIIASFHVSRALITNMKDEPHSKKNPLIKALTSEVLSVIKDIIKLNPSVREQVTHFSYSSGANLLDDPAMLADFSTSIVPFAEASELQAVMESMVIEERLQKALILLKKEFANAKLQDQIDSDVEERMAKTRKEYYVQEQIRGIQKELGLESDGKDKLIQQFQDRIKHLEMPKAVKSVFDEEIAKFKNLDASASEFNVSRNYLDWLTQLPWGKQTSENFDLNNARNILNQDHYGMQDVKDRIMEFIAVGKLNQSVQGKIICLAGPPGVGKTSIGQSIARALGRSFFRFSVGGLSDVSEIKGHRRTYLGAMPGKVIQAFKKVKTENPLILIDEIDKLGHGGHRGDPASALLEVLDPEQNATFMDHYLDVPYDLSKTLFVCTANVLDTIPAPLLDRMEVVQLSGYVAEEKLEIANQYLIPAALKESGINNDQVTLKEGTIEQLLKGYCRESGVRSLKKHIEKIFRKCALQIVKQEQSLPIEITQDNLSTYVGNPVFTSDRIYDKTPPGVVMGLAWTGNGGTALYIESLPVSEAKEGRARIQQTGQMGDVMKESTHIAYTCVQNFVAKYFPENKFFQTTNIHLHVPEGAIKKDGPSAGSTMATALFSLALNISALDNFAMTGELSLTGQVLKIGGVKEKLIAAKRSGVKTIIFPESNKGDYDELASYIKEGVDAHFVRTFDEVVKIVFPGLLAK